MINDPTEEQPFYTDAWGGKFRYGACSTLISSWVLRQNDFIVAWLQDPVLYAKELDDWLPRLKEQYQNISRKQYQDILASALGNNETTSIFDESRDFCRTDGENVAFMAAMRNHPELKPIDNFYADPQNRFIAQYNVHRGLYHNAYGIPQNSVAAVFNAYLAGIRSVEFDVLEKGSAGGQYRYYACSTKARIGATGCTGMSVPMDKLDDAVIDHLETRLLDPERLMLLMEQLLDRREEWADQRRGHVTEMRKRATEAEAKLNRLYEAIENGMLAPDDPSLKDRVVELSSIRDQARADAERVSASVDRLAPTITAESLSRFATAARRKLRDRTSGYRRDHLRALTQRVEVISKTEARIIGSRTQLLRALASSDGGNYAAVGGVRSFEPRWRARKDSNV